MQDADETVIPMTDTGENFEKPRSAAAKRALAEAAARREAEANRAPGPKEKGGRGGLDPTRYGDWEIKGIAADF